MKIGDRLRCAIGDQSWSGEVATIFDDSGDRVDEVDVGTDEFTLVIHLDHPIKAGCDWLRVGPFEPGQLGPMRLH